MKQGVRKSVGSGEQINAFSDPWIPKENNFYPTVLHPVDDGMKVAELIDEDRCWDANRIRCKQNSIDSFDI